MLPLTHHFKYRSFVYGLTCLAYVFKQSYFKRRHTPYIAVILVDIAGLHFKEKAKHNLLRQIQSTKTNSVIRNDCVRN